MSRISKYAIGDYELLDFGSGKKLERFGKVIIERPSPAADGRRASRERAEWNDAHWKFVRDANKGWMQVSKDVSEKENQSEWIWKWKGKIKELSPFELLLKRSPFGHVGVFPEHARSWEWLQSLLMEGSRYQKVPVESKKALHLFAYTGGGSLAVSRTGCQVAHVDSSKPAVTWAKQNAALSDMTESPIRWLVEDSREFVRREVARGNQYDLIIMDPPAYGHGASGKKWEMVVDLEPMLVQCMQLLTRKPLGVLITGHDDMDKETRSEWERRLRKIVSERFDHFDYSRNEINDAAGRPLDFGYSYRWSNISFDK